MALAPARLPVRPALSPSHPAWLAQRPWASALQRFHGKAWAVTSTAVVFACRGLRGRKVEARLRRASSIQIESATDADIRPAAEIAVRSLRWTKGLLDQQNFTNEDYSLLASREMQAYKTLYMAATPYPSTFLVARLEETRAPRKETGSWFDFGSSGVASPKVVGCVGCEVKCFRKFTNEEIPVFRYDGGKETVLRPVMADLAVSSECRGKGIGRKLVQKLEEVVLDWGYDELVLLVEATNFQARGVYDRMGYRLAGIRPQQVTTYLDTSERMSSVVKDRTTVALLLRKSLKAFPLGNLENTNWGLILALLGGAAYWQTSDVGEELGINAEALGTLTTLSKYVSDMGFTVPSLPV